jgi:hypothetical protein
MQIPLIKSFPALLSPCGSLTLTFRYYFNLFFFKVRQNKGEEIRKGCPTNKVSDQKNLSVCIPVTGPYLNFPEPLKITPVSPFWRERKRKIRILPLAGGVVCL